MVLPGCHRAVTPRVGAPCGGPPRIQPPNRNDLSECATDCRYSQQTLSRNCIFYMGLRCGTRLAGRSEKVPGAVVELRAALRRALSARPELRLGSGLTSRTGALSLDLPGNCRLDDEQACSSPCGRSQSPKAHSCTAKRVGCVKRPIDLTE